MSKLSQHSGFKNDVFGPKNVFNKTCLPNQPFSCNFQKNSTNFFSQSENRMSSISNRMSEISEVVEEPPFSSVNNSVEFYSGTIPCLPHRKSLQGSLGSSLMVEENDEQRFTYNAKKIFVGGLPHGLTDQEFRQYFAQYGEIEDCVVMYDRATGKPRGFGFITYKDERSIDAVLRDKFRHKIQNKWVECKRATPKGNCNDSNSSGVEHPTNTSFTYGRDAILLPCNYETLKRKLSVESLAHPIIEEQDSVKISQTTSPNTLNYQNDEFTRKEKKKFNNSYASYEESANDAYFTNLELDQDGNFILDKINFPKIEEDKITTYSDIFEDFHKSENGSNWDVSANDPFDIKDSGFPQALPTSDIGSNLTKEYTQKTKLLMSGPNSKCIEPDKRELTKLIPPILKNELIDVQPVVPDETNSIPSGEQEVLTPEFGSQCTLADAQSHPTTLCSSLKPVYNPGFKCMQNQDNSDCLSMMDDGNAYSAESLNNPSYS